MHIQIKPDPDPNDPSRLFYVSVINGKQYGFLAGPFTNHDEAKSNVAPARKLATQIDPWADFYKFGTCSLPKETPQLPVGKLNQKLNIQIPKELIPHARTTH